MEYTIHKLAQLAGVTTRTLRYYDQLGLLTPDHVTDAGYRVYRTAEIDKLQQIMFYRELGMPLGDIAQVLHEPGFDPNAALHAHLTALEERRAQLDVLILTVKKTIEHNERSESMNDKEKFEGFKKRALEDNEREFGAEVRKRYGAEAVDASYRKFSRLSKKEYDTMTALGKEIIQRLEAAVRAGLDPGAAEGQAIAELHRQWLSFTWASYSAEAHRGVAEMYAADERFTAYYDAGVQGCAVFLRDAIAAYTE